jgi:16S rRNA G966 N2-methylase RsmD
LRASKARLSAEAIQVECTDTMSWMQRSPRGRFDLVLLDPPFDANLFEAALRAAVPLLAPSGQIYLEADRSFDDGSAPLLPLGLRVFRSGRAGAVHYHLLQRLPEEPSPQ